MADFNLPLFTMFKLSDRTQPYLNSRMYNSVLEFSKWTKIDPEAKTHTHSFGQRER